MTVHRKIKRFALSIVLMFLHTVYVISVYIAISTSSDGKAPMLWIIFKNIDFPVSIFIYSDVIPANLQPLFILILGALQWAIIGWILQRILAFIFPRFN